MPPSWKSKDVPPMPPPSGNKALIRPYLGDDGELHNPLIRDPGYFLGKMASGGG